jgi:hypothetical protein
MSNMDFSFFNGVIEIETKTSWGCIVGMYILLFDHRTGLNRLNCLLAVPNIPKTRWIV